jgi:hypothetical protein
LVLDFQNKCWQQKHREKADPSSNCSIDDTTRQQFFGKYLILNHLNNASLNFKRDGKAHFFRTASLIINFQRSRFFGLHHQSQPLLVQLVPGVVGVTAPLGGSWAMAVSRSCSRRMLVSSWKPNNSWGRFLMLALGVKITPFLTSPLGANFDPQGRSCLPGVNFVPWGWNSLFAPPFF